MSFSYMNSYTFYHRFYYRKTMILKYYDGDFLSVDRTRSPSADAAEEERKSPRAIENERTSLRQRSMRRVGPAPRAQRARSAGPAGPLRWPFGPARGPFGPAPRAQRARSAGPRFSGGVLLEGSCDTLFLWSAPHEKSASGEIVARSIYNAWLTACTTGDCLCHRAFAYLQQQ
jgi:hypothetical protein